MSTTCIHCGTTITWCWEEAFDKFGFEDGDGAVMTSRVTNALASHGYGCKEVVCGLHNTVVVSIISPDGRELIPEGTNIGYDDPRTYLPEDVVEFLDREFNGSGEKQS